MNAGFLLCLSCILLNLLCSCSAPRSVHRSLPDDVPINQDAGRGGLLIVNIQLESGDKLPCVVDTGSDGTLFDKSLESKLGKCAGTTIGHGWLGETTNNVYAAPKIYLGGARLITTRPEVATLDFSSLSSDLGRQVVGILGMDVLGNYCVQLDFAAGKMRFLVDDERRETWGKAFPIVALSADDVRPAVSENLFGAQGPRSLIDSGFNGDGWLMPKYFRQWTNAALLRTNGEALWPNGVLGGEKYALVSLPEMDFPSDAIGLRFLARHRVTLDFPNRTLYLLRQSIGPLPDSSMNKFKPIRDNEPKVTARLRAMVQDLMAGTARADDYNAEAWKHLLSKQQAIQEETKRFGGFVSMTLVDRYRARGQRSYRYRLEFTRATLLTHFVFNEQNQLTLGETEAVEWKEPPF